MARHKKAYFFDFVFITKTCVSYKHLIQDKNTFGHLYILRTFCCAKIDFCTAKWKQKVVFLSRKNKEARIYKI